MNGSKSLLSLKHDILNIYSKSVSAVKPCNLIKECISFSNNTITVKGLKVTNKFNYDSGTRINLLGAGKSSLYMTLGFVGEILHQGSNIDISKVSGFLSIPHGQNVTNVEKDILKKFNISWMHGAKDNNPDLDAIEATKAMFKYIDEKIGRIEDDLYIFMLSGGCSACLVSPKYIDLETKKDLTAFVKSRGNIVDVNNVRRYFSDVKAGRLAKRILDQPNSRLVSLILSDVVGDQVEFIGSGPTYLLDDYCDEYERMIDVLNKYNYPKLEQIKKLKSFTRPKLKVCQNFNNRLYNIILGNNLNAIKVAEEKATALGYEVIKIGNDIEDTCSCLVEKMQKFQRNHFLHFQAQTKPCFIIGSGEVMLDVEGNDSFGKGGRCQELALKYIQLSLKELRSNQIPEVLDVLLAGSTDGQDGPTDVAACLSSVYELKKDWLVYESLFDENNINDCLARHDSYNFWSKSKHDWLIKTGLTGTNVMDLYMAAFVKL